LTTESKVDGQGFLDILLGSEARVDLMTLFHKNPGIMDTIDGLARRIGYVPDKIGADLDAILSLGVISKRKMGGREIYSLNKARDSEVQTVIGDYLKNLKPQI
jgi:DNA-binding transcriptional ArsR family regulator